MYGRVEMGLFVVPCGSGRNGDGSGVSMYMFLDTGQSLNAGERSGHRVTGIIPAEAMYGSQEGGGEVKKKPCSFTARLCSPYGIRTRITTVKGWCPSP